MIVVESEAEARAFVASRCEAKDFRRIEAFIRLLANANKQQNLISASSLATVWLRHIADSAQLLDHVPRETSPWLDLGTGAGFPGTVLAILDPDRRYILIESRNLRVRWLNEVVSTLKVSNCEVVCGDVARVAGFKAGVISARAFAPLTRLIALSARFSTTATHWVLPKGRSAEQELAVLPHAQRAMFHVKTSVTDADSGIVVGLGNPELNA